MIFFWDYLFFDIQLRDEMAYIALYYANKGISSTIINKNELHKAIEDEINKHLKRYVNLTEQDLDLTFRPNKRANMQTEIEQFKINSIEIQKANIKEHK